MHQIKTMHFVLGYGLIVAMVHFRFGQGLLPLLLAGAVGAFFVGVTFYRKAFVPKDLVILYHNVNLFKLPGHNTKIC
jgi:hypothetical protein